MMTYSVVQILALSINLIFKSMEKSYVTLAILRGRKHSKKSWKTVRYDV